MAEKDIFSQEIKDFSKLTNLPENLKILYKKLNNKDYLNGLE